MSNVMAEDDDCPKAGRPCGRCKKPTGEWMKKFGESGSWWVVQCDSCGNNMSRARILPGEFLDNVKALADVLEQE